MVKKTLMIYKFVLTQLTNVTDRQTDTQTDSAYTTKAALDASITRQKSSDFHEILYTAADFELDERHVIKN